MTFILNLLHKDMSLLAADQLATVSGPATITVGNITIHAQKGAKVHGFSKLTSNDQGTIALGMAGNTGDHSYFDRVQHAPDADEVLRLIRAHMDGLLAFHDRERFVQLTSAMENQGIATFFDPAVGSFFSNFYLFSAVHAFSRLYATPPGGNRLIHAGSGSDAFEKAVGLDSINAFIASISESVSLDTCIEWFRDAYQKVSAIDPGSGGEPKFLVATRDDPVFRSAGVS